jgi:hypothetical protein
MVLAGDTPPIKISLKIQLLRNFSLTYSFRPPHGPGVDSASNRNEYQGSYPGVKATGA